MQGHHASASVSPASREDALAPLLPAVSGRLSSDSVWKRSCHTELCLLCSPGLRAVPCASQHRGAVNINGNGNRRRLLPAPGAGRADERGVRTTARCLEPKFCWLLPPAPSALCWTGHPGLSLAQPVLIHTAFPQQIHRGALKIPCSPSLALGRAGTEGTVLSFSPEILLCGAPQRWLCTAAPSHCQAAINTNK